MKKIIAMIMVMCMFIGTCALSADALCTNEASRPDIIGMEHFDAVKELDERYDNGEIEPSYNIQMGCIEGYWCVALNGNGDFDDYCAFGMYDHAPTEEEFDILWANRMTADEMDALMEQYGF